MRLLLSIVFLLVIHGFYGQDLDTTLYAKGRGMVKDANVFIKMNPKSAKNYWQRARGYLYQDQFDQARIDIDSAVKLDSSNLFYQAKQSGMHRLYGKPKKALEGYLEIYPKCKQDWILDDMTICWTMTKKYSAGRAYMEKLMLSDPENAHVFYNHGILLFKQGVFDGHYYARLTLSYQSLSRAIALKKNFKEAYFSRGWVLEFLNKKKQSCSDYYWAKMLGHTGAKSRYETQCKDYLDPRTGVKKIIVE